MKRFLLVSLFGVFLSVGVNATAPQCISISTAETKSSVLECYVDTANLSDGYAEWSLSCKMSNLSNSVTLRGVGACSRLKGSAQFVTRSANLPTIVSNGDETNIHCWCRIISPAVSDWVYVRTYTEPDNCALSCAWRCADFSQTSNKEGANYKIQYLEPLLSTLVD